jgi:hypothetical protein
MFEKRMAWVRTLEGFDALKAAVRGVERIALSMKCSRFDIAA